MIQRFGQRIFHIHTINQWTIIIFKITQFRDYPVVGITWDQAMRYCQWKSETLNELLANSEYTIEFTLPTDAEWQYAACGPKPGEKGKSDSKQNIFPWGSFFLFPHTNKEGFHLNCNSGPAKTHQGFTLITFVSDDGLYTLPVKSFEPNGYGMYQMSGNVAEWTIDDFSIDYDRLKKAREKFADNAEIVEQFTPQFQEGTYEGYKIIKGGSWVDEPFYMQIGVVKIQHPRKASSTVGFRPVMRVLHR